MALQALRLVNVRIPQARPLGPLPQSRLFKFQNASLLRLPVSEESISATKCLSANSLQKSLSLHFTNPQKSQEHRIRIVHVCLLWPQPMGERGPYGNLTRDRTNTLPLSLPLSIHRDVYIPVSRKRWEFIPPIL